MMLPQRGIFYRKKFLNPSKIAHSKKHQAPNSTFGMIFIRIDPRSQSREVGHCLQKLWKMYDMLCAGKVTRNSFSVPAGNLSVLIGYGPKIFELNGIVKNTPAGLSQFLPPTSEGGNILDGCGIRYTNTSHLNLGLTDDVVIQVIASRQLAVYRAIAETWKHISSYANDKVLHFSRFYSGFQRDDYRSWLGFHDEISNMNNAKERKEAIFIHPRRNDLQLRDYWTTGGTYMAFLRILIKLSEWEKLSVDQQELAVGRDKETGYPIVGVDRRGRPVRGGMKAGYPMHSLNLDYRNHPNYFELGSLPKRIRTKLEIRESTRLLSRSHIGRARRVNGGDVQLSKRIYRQSFDFVELEEDENANEPLKAGLNFVSFQNDPRTLFFILSDPNWMGGSNFGGGITNLLSVLASGVFYVPPLENPFPGVSIFRNMR